MTYARKTDANQTAMITALRRVGAAVVSLRQIGKGCPDLLVAFRGMNYLLEVKDGSKPRSKRALTPAEKAWHEQWQRVGQVAIVATIDEALKVIGAI
jgi:hypothetical protein